MLKVLYIANSLSFTGPSNQLHYIIQNLDRAVFEPHLLVLSTAKHNRINDFRSLGLAIYEAKTKRINPKLDNKKKIQAIIESVKPDIIHSQGFRPDIFMSKLNSGKTNWLLTLRNYPYEDYPMKFGPLLGRFMAWLHLKAIKKCSHVVTCSETIQNKLLDHNISSKVIYNGTKKENKRQTSVSLTNVEKPLFLVVGSLIKRKNNETVVNAFNTYKKTNPGTLMLLGDGVELEKLKSRSNGNIIFKGKVNNVQEYMQNADYLISASLSEGLPNNVLEALANHLPVIISDIPPHLELNKRFPHQCKVFDLSKSSEVLPKILEQPGIKKETFESSEFISTFRNNFSAESMSNNYQKFYLSLIKNNNPA